MTLFWSVAFALLLLGMWIVAGSVLRKPAQDGRGTASQRNLAVLKAQLAQLDQELAAGRLDDAQHRQSRAEIERRALEEESVTAAPERSGSPRTTLALLLVAVPTLALALYGTLGTPQAMSPLATMAGAGPHGDPTQEQMEGLVAKLAERMEKRPPGQVEDTEGWVMLGRSYAAMQRYAEAQRAFARALQLMPDEPQILADQADVLAMLQGRNLEGEPLKLIEQALKSNPSNLKALALAGTAAFERKDFAGAIHYWSRARVVAPPDGDFAQGLDRSIAEARIAAGGNAAAVALPAQPKVAAAASATAPAQGVSSISGRVSLSPALAARVATGDTLFVFARAAEGPRMPLAILRRSASELPLSFTLDDSMAMAPQFKLSSFARVVIGARISKSGNATPQSGDLEGQSPPTSGRDSGIDLVIDSVRP